MTRECRRIEVQGDWYIAELLEQCEPVERDETDTERSCTIWQNAVLINATSPAKAYDKAVRLGRREYSSRYRAVSGDGVEWTFVGVVSLIPVYEDIGDGGEQYWTDHGEISARSAQAMVRRRADLLGRLERGR